MATTSKIRPKVDKIIIGTKMPLNDEDIHLIEEKRKEKEALPEHERLARFDNVIHKSGWCGFANGGQVDYILNTNPLKTYNVTINVDWRRGIENGFFTETHVVPAGGKIRLGCTQTNNIPVTMYQRRVVGEV